MNWEFKFLYFLQKLHKPFIDKLMVLFTKLGNCSFIWFFIATIFILTKKYKECGIMIYISLTIMLIIGNLILKNSFKRKRPCWRDKNIKLLIKNPKDYSFPSGHTYSSIVASTMILLYHPFLGIFALILALLISFSRMYLFVHFPTDILASLLLGVATSLVTYFIKVFYLIDFYF